MSKFRKKPVVIEAMQWAGDLAALAPLFSPGTVHDPHGQRIIKGGDPKAIVSGSDGWLAVDNGDVLTVNTLEGPLAARLGDWIIKGVAGEFYPCKPDIFTATYEAVSDADA